MISFILYGPAEVICSFPLILPKQQQKNMKKKQKHMLISTEPLSLHRNMSILIYLSLHAYSHTKGNTHMCKNMSHSIFFSKVIYCAE